MKEYAKYLSQWRIQKDLTDGHSLRKTRYFRYGLNHEDTATVIESKSLERCYIISDGVVKTVISKTIRNNRRTLYGQQHF